MKIFTLMAQIEGLLPNALHGGGKGAPAPIPIAPPEAPPPEDTAMLETKDTPTETKKAQTKGAKSLQIPLGTIGGNKPLNI